MTTTAVVPPISTGDLEWIRLLAEQIWYTTAPDRFSRELSWPTRELTKGEWERVKAIIARYDLPAELHSDSLGHLSMLVYQHPEAPGVPAAAWFSIQMDHLPGMKKRVGYDDRFAYGWGQIAPIAETARNQELIRLYALKPTRKMSYYVY